MNPLGTREQCPFCLAHLRLTKEGKLHKHEAGRVRKRCPGSGKTKAGAAAMKANMRAGSALRGYDGSEQAEPRPEDIF